MKTKSGRPPLLPFSLESEIIDILKDTAQVGGKITPQTVTIIAKAVIKNSEEPEELKSIDFI